MYLLSGKKSWHLQGSLALSFPHGKQEYTLTSQAECSILEFDAGQWQNFVEENRMVPITELNCDNEDGNSETCLQDDAIEEINEEIYNLNECASISNQNTMINTNYSCKLSSEKEALGKGMVNDIFCNTCFFKWCMHFTSTDYMWSSTRVHSWTTFIFNLFK